MSVYNKEDCRFFHRTARDHLRFARHYPPGNRFRIIQQERAADYREVLVNQMRRRAGWTLAEIVAGKRDRREVRDGDW